MVGSIAKSRFSLESIFENLITMKELLELFKGQYSRQTVYNWINRDGMPKKKLRGKLWFDKSEVLQWLERSSE